MRRKTFKVRSIFFHLVFHIGPNCFSFAHKQLTILLWRFECKCERDNTIVDTDMGGERESNNNWQQKQNNNREREYERQRVEKNPRTYVRLCVFIGKYANEKLTIGFS